MARVAIARTPRAEYPSQSPFHPSERYLEYPFDSLADEPNEIYSGVRDLFRLLEFDKVNFGRSNWNPLGWLVKPGMNVVLKPNLVLSRHHEGGNVFSIITHPSVLRAIADYIWIAQRGKGRIIIADAPQYNCNWKELMQVTGLELVNDFYN